VSQQLLSPNPRRALAFAAALALAACLSAGDLGAAALPAGLRAREGVATQVDVAAQVEGLLRQVSRAEPERWPHLEQQLAGLGSAALGPCVTLLAGHCMDSAEQGGHQPRLRLALEQEHVLMGALLRMPRASVRAFLQQLAQQPDALCEKLVGLGLLERMGQSEDVLLATRLSAPAQVERTVHPVVRAAYGQSLDGILAREPLSPSAVASAYGEVHPALVARLVQSVGRPRTKESLALLAGLLGRYAAADGLLLVEIGRHGRALSHPVDEDVIVRARDYLDSLQANLVIEAAIVCAEFEDTRCAQRLVELLADPRPGVSKVAQETLARISGADPGPDAVAWQDWYEAQSRWWQEQAPALLAALDSGPPVDIARALKELVEHPLYRDELAPRLAGVVQRSESELAVLACAVLGQLGSRLGAPALLEALEAPDPRLRQEARLALARLYGHDLGPDPDSWPAGARE
jgi:HEAT repeat protein